MACSDKYINGPHQQKDITRCVRWATIIRSIALVKLRTEFVCSGCH